MLKFIDSAVKGSLAAETAPIKTKNYKFFAGGFGMCPKPKITSDFYANRSTSLPTN